MSNAEAKPLAGKVALITGAAKRLGRASALALAEAGAHVAITFLHSEKEAERTVKELEALRNSVVKGFRKSTTEDTLRLPPRQAPGHRGRRRVNALAVQCDVTDPNSVRAAIKAVVEEFGGIDILVNNAGNYETVEFEKLTLQQWDAIFASNVRAPFLVSQAALPHLRRRRGRIIHLGSLGGLRAWADHAHYCSSKAALHMLTKVMAKALAPEIAVNCVAPGMIDLGEKSAVAFMRRMAKQTPMRRNGSREDVAAAVRFFATVPHFVTGQILYVDGGLGL
jgi:NAD(P)-dependent dehydrogenase (short-subunit alcohol dehydrogenase family)